MTQDNGLCSSQHFKNKTHILMLMVLEHTATCQLEVPKMESSFHSIIVVGQIEGHLVLPHRIKLPNMNILSPIGIMNKTPKLGLLVILNTVGGDVEKGLP